MEKDDFLKILDSASSHNINNYIYDREWSLSSGLSYSFDKNIESEKSKFMYGTEKQNESENVNKKEKNILKILDNELEESQFYEKIKKEAEDSRIHSSHQFAQDFHNNMEQIYLNKSLFYSKFAKSKSKNRYIHPQLNILNNHLLEKNFLKNNIQESFPGLKPSTSWPMALGDLIEKLSTLKLEEMFHQPFDLYRNFHNDTKEFIKSNLTHLNKLVKDGDETQVLIYKEYLQKAIQIFVTVKIHEGNYTNFTDMLEFLKTLHEEHSNLGVFSEIFSEAMRNCQDVFKLLSEYINSLTDILPLMRNYAINDLFYISKNILYSPSRNNSGNGNLNVSIANNSTFLYIILSGTNGSMIKVGTGMNGTEKGKVYFSKPWESEDSVSWVYCKGKLYLKKSSNELGYLDIINPNKFELEGKIKLMINESCLHNIIRKKNENFILLTNGEKLQIILLEPKLNKNAEDFTNETEIANKNNKEDEEEYDSDEEYNANKNRIEKKAKQISIIMQNISLVMYEFDVSKTQTSKLTEDKKSLIEELKESFSLLFNEEECKKALIISNWDFEKAALFLIDQGEKIKEPLLLFSKKITLFQSKLDFLFLESNDFRRAGLGTLFEIVPFDEFKWISTGEYLIAYKLKGGYAFIFSVDESQFRVINQEECDEFLYDEFELKNPDSKNLKEKDANNEGNIAESSEEPTNEEKMEERVIKGTFLKKVNSIELSKQDFSITYDRENQSYYLMTESVVSQSIIKIDTMKRYCNNLSGQYLQHNGFSNIDSIFRKLFDSEFITKFNNFYEIFFHILFVIGTRKPDLYSKYRNWNIYLFTQFDKLYNLLDSDGDLDFNKKLILYFKYIQSRFDKTLEYDFVKVKSVIDEKILKNYEVNNNSEMRIYKFKKPKNNKQLKAQLDINKWYFFGNNSSIQFDLKKELTEKKEKGSNEEENKKNSNLILHPKEYYFENKIDYYLSANGDLESLKSILKLIENSIGPAAEVENSNLINKLFMLYLWFESADVSVGFKFANSNDYRGNDGNYYNEDISKVIELLDKLYDIDNQIMKNIIFMLVLSGWEIICNTAEAQIKWFLRAFEFSQKKFKELFERGTNFENFENLYHKFSLIPTSNRNFGSENISANKDKYNILNYVNRSIEEKIININMFNSNENSEFYKYLPIFVFLDRIEAMNEWNFPYLFYRISQIRMFSFKPKLEDEKILILRQIQIKFNPKNNVFPFHWMLNKFYIRYINIEKEKQLSKRLNEVYKSQFIYMGENKEIISYPIFYLNPQVVYFNFSEFNSLENNLKDFSFSATKLDSEEKFSENFPKYLENCEKLNNLLNNFSNQKILNSLDNLLLEKIIELKANCFMNIVGDFVYLKECYQFLLIPDINKVKSLQNYEIPSKKKNYQLFLEMYMGILESNFSSISSFLTILLEEKTEIKNANLIKNIRTNILKYFSFFFYSSLIFMKKFNLELQKDLKTKFLKLLNYSINILTSNKNISYDESELKKIIQNLKTYSSNGFQIENEKNIEYSIIPNEPINISELISFGDAHCIAVEIDFLNLSQDKNRIDLQIVSHEHGYNNFRNSHNYNNHNNFGTAFLVEIAGNNVQKKLFLPGKEIKIMYTNEGRRYYRGDSVVGKTKENENGIKISNKNILKIKCYPIKTQSYLIENSTHDKTLLEEFLFKKQVNKSEFLLWLDFINDLDYILNWIIQNNIKSLDISKDEKLLIDNQIGSLCKLGLNTYKEIKIEEINLSPKIDDLSDEALFTEKKESSKEIIDFKNPNQFEEIFKFFYDSIITNAKQNPNNNKSKFFSLDRLEEVLGNCQSIWKNMSSENKSKKNLDIFIFDYILSELEENYGIDLGNTFDSPKYRENLINIKSKDNDQKKIQEDKKIPEEKELKFTDEEKELKFTEEEKKEEIMKKKSCSEFYSTFLESNKIIYEINNKAHVEYLLDLLIKISESNEIINLNNEKNILFDFLKAVKRVIPEAYNYRTLKMLPSFNQKMKNIWIVIEALFLYCVSYHLNLSGRNSINILIKQSENSNNSDQTLNNSRSILEFLGKKLNALISWMTSRVQYMKDTFDTIRNESELICEKNNKFLEIVKNLCLDKIKLKRKEKEEEMLKKIEEEQKELLHKKNESKKNKEEVKKPEKTPIEKLKEEMGNKPFNYKKKGNVKRLYQEIPRKKTIKKDDGKKELKDEKKDEEKNPKENSQNEKEKINPDYIPYEEFLKKTLEEIFTYYPDLKIEFMNKENIKAMKDGIKMAIENDIKDSLFGNNEKLKNICEINDINFSESNPNESLKNYSNFIINKLKSVYDFEESNTCNEMDSDQVSEKVYKDSPYKVLSDYILEKILFLLELNNDNSINVLELSPNLVFANFNQNLKKSFSKKISTTVFIDNARIESLKANEENFLTPHQILIVKSIFNFIFKSPQVDLLRELLNIQYKRFIVRKIGFDYLNQLISDESYKSISSISLNILGILSCALNNTILNGIETMVKKLDTRVLDLEKILVFNLHHINNEINHFLMLDKNNFRKFMILDNDNISSSRGNSNFGRENLDELLQYFESGNIETFYTHKIKNLVLILSDINLIVSYINNTVTNLAPREVECTIPVEILKKFIDSSIKIILNSDVNSYPKFAKNIVTFSNNLKLVLGKIITYKNNQTIISAVLDALFSCLDVFHGKLEEQSSSIVNILEIIHHIVSMLPHSSFLGIDCKSNLDKLLNLIFESDIPQIINVSCKVAKLFLRSNLTMGDGFDSDSAVEKIWNNLYEKIGKLWLFNNFYLDETMEKKNVSFIVEKNPRQDLEKKYYILIQMNSPEFDYLFILNALFQWEEKYPTNLSAYNQSILKTLEEYSREEIEEWINHYNQSFDKDKNLDCYKIDYEKFKNKYNQRSLNSSKISRNEYKIILHKFREMTYFNPLKVKINKTHHVQEIISKNISEVENKMSEINKKLQELKEAKEKAEKKLSEQIDNEKNNDDIAKTEEINDGLPIPETKSEEKNENIEEKNENIEEKNENIEDKNENIEEKNENIEDKNENIEDKNENIEDKNENIEDKNKNIEDKNKNIEEKNENIEDKNKENNEEKNKENSDENKKEIIEEPKISQEEKINQIKRELELLQIRVLYNKRISEHIKQVELIGENASGRGFVIIDGDFTKEKAEDFSNLIYKAFHKLIPSILSPENIFTPPKILNLKKSDKEVNTEKLLNEPVIQAIKYFFSDNLIFPGFHEYDTLSAGCTNILKETTKQFLNVSLIENSVYLRFAQTMNIFNEKFFLKSDQENSNSKKPVTGNFNEHGKKILNEKNTNGKSIYIILEELIGMIIPTNTNFETEGETNQASLFLIAKLLNKNLNLISKESWESCEISKKFFILGLLIVSSGFFNILRVGSLAMFNNNNKEICKIITGGHLTGKNTSNIIFLKDKSLKIQKVNNSQLKKINPLLNKSNNIEEENNLNILNLKNFINVADLVNILDNALEIYKKNEKNELNKNLVLFLLKLLNNFTHEDLMMSKENNIIKFLEISEKLEKFSTENKWLGKTDEEWEIEFIDCWQRIYSKLDRNSLLFYSPPKRFMEEMNSSITNLIVPNSDTNELITKLTMPDSSYGTDLPNLTDLSKCTLALKNIQNFERYTVEEVYRYCNNTYKEYEYLNSLSQIRYHLSNNDIASAKTDIYYIFDQNKVPPHMPLPKEHRDMREVFKEECYPGNYYLAKINQRIAREAGIPQLTKWNNLGLNEVPILLLLVDVSLNQALVQYDDWEQSKISSFWISLDSLFALDYQMKVPSSSITFETLKYEYDDVSKNLMQLYSKNILVNLNRVKLYYQNLKIEQENNAFNIRDLMQFLNLEFWQLNKSSPIKGVFSSFKNYIKVQQFDLGLKTKESFINIDNSNSIDIYQTLNQINHMKKGKLSKNSDNSMENIENKTDEIERYLFEVCTFKEENLLALKNWCFENWDNFFRDTKHLQFDLFKEYMSQFNNMRSNKQFNLGNMGNKLLALHELTNLNNSEFCGIILSFEQSAILGPNAKLSFYSDKEGVNLIHEITAIKNTKTNLQSVMFNYSMIWMNYTPGTRAFYIHDWHIQTRDSELPCCITFVPYYWSSLIWLSDFTTSSLFSSYKLENLEYFKDYIKKLLGFCTSTKIPVDLQRNIFNITNRIILKANKFISILESKRLIIFNEMPLYEKMNILGIDDFSLIELIKHIDRFNSNNVSKDKNFSSSYVVDGVEIILSILSVIKESYSNLDNYFRENLDYSLPIWIEAIIKLGQFLNLFQNVSSLENELFKEIKNETVIKDQNYDLFIVRNIPGYIPNDVILGEVKKIANSLNVQIVDVDIDIVIIDKNRNKFEIYMADKEKAEKIKQIKDKEETKKDEKQEKEMIEEVQTNIQNGNCENENKVDKDAITQENSVEEIKIYKDIDKNYTKEMCILIDGVKVETLKEIDESAEEEVSSMWICAGCEMENDNENAMCIFCDREKTIKPKEKKKKTLMKVDSFNQSAADILLDFKNSLKNNPLLNSFTYEIPEIIEMKENKDNETNKDNKQIVQDQKVPSELIEGDKTNNGLEALPFSNGEIPLVENELNKLNKKSEKNNKKYTTEKITKELDVSCPDELKKNKNNTDLISQFYKNRLAKWIILRGRELKDILSNLKLIKSEVSTKIDILLKLITLQENDKSLFQKIFLEDYIENETSNEEIINLSKLDYFTIMQEFENNYIDNRFEIIEVTDEESKDINLENLEKIREIIDLTICKETNISFVFPPRAVRFIQDDLNSINCFTNTKLKNAIKNSYECSKKQISLGQIRFYWSIIKYFNNCLLAALPFIKPSDMNSVNVIPIDDEYTYIPFQKSISAFLSSAKGLTFSFTKQNLIREVISFTEFPEEQIQIPTFKFERLNIYNNLNKENRKKSGDQPVFIRDGNNNDFNNENDEDENMTNEKELKVEESMFLQAFEQYKDIDIAFFRSKKAPGDPHIGFKVEFKGELVQGIGGPYRQFFSDLSLELQPRDFKTNKILKLLYPSSNHQAQKGDFKEKFVIRPLLNDNNSLNQFEFLGALMGICIRTGVHMTLDLCSIFWKKLTEESITVEDINEFDEGLLEQIAFLKNDIDQETFENSLNKNYCIELTDNTLFELIPGGAEKKVNFEDRFNYMKLVIKARLTESDEQIAAIKRGLCKVVPYSLIKLLTFKELEQLVCGKKIIDIDLLKSHTNYMMDLTAESNRSKWLWEILSEITEEDRVKFIKFCWGQERLPVTKEEYEKLQINFKIKPHIDRKRKDIFPKADTCFFSLELPDYSSQEIMKKLILTAINYDNVSINADKITNENMDHHRDNYRDNYDYDSE